MSFEKKMARRKLLLQSRHFILASPPCVFKPSHVTCQHGGGLFGQGSKGEELIWVRSCGGPFGNYFI
jgi:hypothetical protein